MSRIDAVTFEVVDLLPKELADGVVYVSLENRTVVHKCCSGCGERVVVNLSPAGWKLTFDGETISLSPSIGNGSLACKSHYWIQENRVVWAMPLTSRETQRSQLADRSSVMTHHRHRNREDRWQRIKRRWRNR